VQRTERAETLPAGAMIRERKRSEQGIRQHAANPTLPDILEEEDQLDMAKKWQELQDLRLGLQKAIVENKTSIRDHDEKLSKYLATNKIREAKMLAKKHRGPD
jgi:flagellar biosynthesis/type III secretory pathway chaperone